MTEAVLVLKAGREKSVLQKHPWIFSGAVERVEGEVSPGETVRVDSRKGEGLGLAAYSQVSSIRARMWSWYPQEIVDQSFLRIRLQQALEMRARMIPANETNAYRLVHAESDGIPGLIVDRYNDWLVVQFLSAGVEYWREVIVQLLIELTGIQNIYERSDVDVRQLEGLEERAGLMVGCNPPERVAIYENGLQFWVDIQKGQKTGFYLDQRHNRQRVRELVNGLSVLNCFCYTGAFSVYALAGGANHVLSVDVSASALEIGRDQLNFNSLDPQKTDWLEADVFQALRTFRDQGRSFDSIILDPPKFAATTTQVEKAARGYKDINLLAIKLVKPGGLLFTFSCSGGISSELFQKIVAGAALDARRNVLILERLSQGPDHPVALNFPEGAYLKGLVCRIGQGH